MDESRSFGGLGSTHDQAVLMEQIIAFAITAVLAVPLFVFVHIWLERCYLAYGRRYCKRHGFVISRYRCGPLFNMDGIKTEFSLVEVDCLDKNQRHVLLRLRVWAFGVCEVLSADDFPLENMPAADQDPAAKSKSMPDAGESVR